MRGKAAKKSSCLDFEEYWRQSGDVAVTGGLAFQNVTVAAL
jgi:hypothetical protein